MYLSDLWDLRSLTKRLYGQRIQPVCEAYGLTRMEMDILLFLANNPAYNTAKDICQCRGVKPGIVSVHVDRLVNLGLLARQDVPGDRRKTRLVCTDQAAPLIARGRTQQQAFAARLTDGLSSEELTQFHKCIAAFSANLDAIRASGI